MEIYNSGYWCTYSYKSDSHDYFALSNEACYSRLFKLINVREDWDRGGFLGERKPERNGELTFYIENTDKRGGAYCICTKEEVVQWVETLKRIFPFEYRIEEAVGEVIKGLGHNPFTGYIITVAFLELQPIEIKLLCTFMRYLYEEEFSVALKEAISLVNYRIISVENLIIAFQFVLGFYTYNSNHSIEREGWVHKPLSIEEWVKLISEYKEERNIHTFVPRSWRQSTLLLSKWAVSGKKYWELFTTVEESFTHEEVLKRYEKYYFQNLSLYKGISQNLFKPNREITVPTIYVVGGDKGYAKPFLPICKLVDRMEDANIVLFTGGEDVSPELYGADKHPTTYSNLNRDIREIKEFRRSLSIPKVVLRIGICRGSQFLCVMNGGMLVQDVVRHAIAGTHRIKYTPPTKRRSKCLEITSTHHQMQYPYNLPQRDYKLIAIAETNHSIKGWNYYYEGQGIDKEKIQERGEPEIVLYKKTNSLAIQGHPEMMDKDNPTLIELRNLVKSLIK